MSWWDNGWLVLFGHLGNNYLLQTDTLSKNRLYGLDIIWIWFILIFLGSIQILSTRNMLLFLRLWSEASKRCLPDLADLTNRSLECHKNLILYCLAYHGIYAVHILKASLTDFAWLRPYTWLEHGWEMRDNKLVPQNFGYEVRNKCNFS